MFRFDVFCEKWATSYKPLSHKITKDGKGRRFFRHDTLDENVAFIQSMKTLNSGDLLMSAITAFDGELTMLSEKAISPDFVNWRRHVLFWAKMKQATAINSPMGEDAAAEAKARAVEHAMKFVAFLDKVSDKRNKPFYIGELAGIDMKEIQIVTLPVSYNGWWAAAINMDHIEPRPKCIIEQDYDEELVNALLSENFH